MFDFLKKKRYPENMCRRKHGEKARKFGHTASEYNKNSTYKGELELQREV